MTTTPHVIPYQGSKRKLAPRICHFFPRKVETLYEPFAGSAAVSIYAAKHHLVKRFVIGDILAPLVLLQKLIIEHPDETAKQYESIWMAQGNCFQERYDYFFSVRTKFNQTRDPVLLLFLIARCVANAVRFGMNGNFTQSPDKRRMGTVPERMRKNIFNVSGLLKGKCDFYSGDYVNCLNDATARDVVYLDPPYRGTTEGTDKRYFKQVETNHLIKCLDRLNKKRVPFILSYDGTHGDKQYGDDLPADLNCEKFSLKAGRSTQGTLSGRVVHTTESLYVSRQLKPQPKSDQLALALIQ